MRLHERILAALAVLGFLARIIPGPRTVDDAFITFRYSRNIIEGSGFVYNAGERILGTTTPLYTLLMALFGALLGGDYPWYALVVNATAGACGVILIFFITEHLTGKVEFAAWAGVLWAFAPYSVTFAVGGMETAAHNAFMLGAWYAYLKDKPRWMGAACALGVLTRPDALIWAAPLLLHHLWRHWKSVRAHLGMKIVGTGFTLPAGARSDNMNVVPTSDFQERLNIIPWQTWLVGLLTVAPWVIFATLYFGSPLPHTVSTKAQVYSLPSTQALVIFLQHYATPFQEQFTLGRYGIMAGIVLYPALALIGLRATTARDSRALPILLYPWIYFAVFVILNPLIFRWYLTPPLPAYFISILCGIGALLDLIPRRESARTAYAGIAALTVLFTLNSWTLNPDHPPNRPAPQMAFHELELHYEIMAKTLRSEYGVDENTLLAAGDIGALGYYSRARIFDTVGLVTENTVDYYDPDLMAQIRLDDANYAIPPDLILDAQPDFVVVMEAFVREGLLKDERFQQQYNQIEFIPSDFYGAGMLAFRRNDLE